MHQHLLTVLGLGLGLASAEIRSVTPHQQYSSSIGVPGCLIDTNRVAYFPNIPTCDEPCVRVTHAESGRELTLLHIDTSGGAWDISYDAWNILISGYSASQSPQTGGGVDMEVAFVGLDDGECQALLGKTNGKIPLMAISPNWAVECPDVDVEFYNFGHQSCTTGSDEICHMDGNVMNCPSGVGAANGYNGPTVTDLDYGTGREIPSPKLIPRGSGKGK